MNGAMERADQYRANAEHAERMAKLAHTEDERRAYARIAQGWRDLEHQAQRGQRR
jgi:hypothetical protein